MELKSSALRGLKCYFGDIHNHCGVSYGHGGLEDAFANARLQLDFASVTGHSSWPDIPARTGIMESVVDYHVAGFTKLESRWDHFVRVTESFNDPGSFVTFLSYEIHSMKDGDYTAVFRSPPRNMFKPPSIRIFQEYVAEENRRGNKCLLLPHHIGYKTGYRGINWDTFSEEASPLLEIVSMHGCSESDDAPFPYLHTMGPRCGGNTMQGGLARGCHFGVSGSTDHHSAHPGSYGFGRTGVWAPDLSRESVWDALAGRRTFAVSGDKMLMAFAVNGSPMGSRISASPERTLEFSVKGGYALDYIEVVKNNRVLIRKDTLATPRGPDVFGRGNGKTPVRGKVHLEVGWGEKGTEQTWEVSASVRNGALLDVEPRFHGVDIVDPKDSGGTEYRFSSLTKRPDGADFTTKTRGNPTATSHAAQGVSLEIEGTGNTEIRLEANGRKFRYTLEELSAGTATEYLGGFLTGALCIHRFVPEDEYTVHLEADDPAGRESDSDFYYVRASQKNGQWGWTSPVRVL